MESYFLFLVYFLPTNTRGEMKKKVSEKLNSMFLKLFREQHPRHRNTLHFIRFYESLIKILHRIHSGDEMRKREWERDLNMADDNLVKVQTFLWQGRRTHFTNKVLIDLSIFQKITFIDFFFG